MQWRSLLTIILLATAGACSREEHRSTQTSTAPVGLTRVDDPSKVCMVNDRYMGSAQIPVDVNGKRYFGCCAMCKQKLETSVAARTGTDPVSGAPVDKASAVITRDASGKILYFESEATLARYTP